MCRRTSSTALGLLLCIALLASIACAQTSRLTVDLRSPRATEGRSPWGLFFEEINHAGDGGLYAERVRNRSFEEPDALSGWQLIEEGAASGSMDVDGSLPLNARNPHAVRLTAALDGEGRVGLANGGYWGVPAQLCEFLQVTFWARRSEGSGDEVTVRLEHPSGVVCAESRVAGLTTEWSMLSCRLEVDRGDPPSPEALLTLSVSSPGTYWFDMVSLMPSATFHNRENGMRPDLAAMLQGIRPSFLRFPGGCFVEGDVLANASRWKDTIGPTEERPGHWNLWGYRSTDGLGYHEYLELCEDLSADPLFVVNCGMAHGDVVPMDQLDEWVQDALDAIEYANGPADSTWGRVRAASGHPEPFGLRYVEIGNENGGPAYEERYARFYQAIKERYPEISLIADTRVTSAPMEILDEHYYSSPDWFASQLHRYDTYDRKGPKIYVGEYACTQECGQGNLQAALGEATFMLGIERNSDIVTMASYAPLFVNVRDRRWNPDAIFFDGSSAAGTPSYWVQHLFGSTPLSQVGSAAFEGPEPTYQPHGGIGLGTWATQAEFRDIVVRSGDQVLYSSDFTSEAAGWHASEGDWSVADGAYRQTGPETGAWSLCGDREWGDYTLELKARKLGGDEGFLIVFHARGDNDLLWWNLGGWGNRQHAVEKTQAGKRTIGQAVDGSIETGRWYDIRIELTGDRIRCYLDGALVHEVSDAPPDLIAANAGRDSNGNILIRVVNRGGRSHTADIALEGVGALEPEGTATVLTGMGPEDENTLSEPRRVAPVDLPLTGVGPTFRHTFRPYSLTVLTLRERAEGPPRPNDR